MNKENIINSVKDTLKLEAQVILDSVEKSSSQIANAVELILKSKGKIVVCGVGKSGYIAQKIAASLCSTGSKAVFLHPVEAVHGDLGIYEAGDPTILISKSGSTRELVRLIPILKNLKSPIISIAGNPNSQMAEKADVFIDASVSKEADDINIVPTSSTTLALSIGDAITIALMQAHHFTDKDFARFHPGGQLGRSLLMHAEDILKPIENCAVATANTPIRELVIKMTEKPLGAALILDSNKQLEGIVVEGDIRRAFIKHQNVLDLNATDIMKKNPICAKPDMPVKDLINLMENRPNPINVLPVIENSKCIGLIRIHDLYQPELM